MGQLLVAIAPRANLTGCAFGGECIARNSIAALRELGKCRDTQIDKAKTLCVGIVAPEAARDAFKQP